MSTIHSLVEQAIETEDETKVDVILYLSKRTARTILTRFKDERIAPLKDKDLFSPRIATKLLKSALTEYRDLAKEFTHLTGTVLK
jgi:Holliday junction resolvasome RuvABC DNA-binding subunit